MEKFIQILAALLLLLLIGDATAYTLNQLNQQQQEQLPTITPFSFDQNVQENQRSSVLCTISSGELPVSISWLKDGQLLTHQLAQAKKIIIKPDSDQSTLKFASVRLEHAGNYTCVAKNRAGIEVHSAQLVVHGEPRWLKEPMIEPIVTTMGQTVTIDCLATGWPRPQQSWLRKSHQQSEFESLNLAGAGGKVSLAPNGSLIIRNVEKRDEANYMCTSYNGIGRGLTASTSLRVVVPAHFVVGKQQPTVIRKQNQVQLRCDAFGDEPISIEWFKNKQRLANELDPRFSIHNKPLQNGLISILVIKSAQRQDNSVYECITRNTVGKDRLPSELVVQEEPDAIQELKVVQVGSRSATFEWVEPYDGKSAITSYLFQYRKLESNAGEFQADSPALEQQALGMYPFSQGDMAFMPAAAPASPNRFLEEGWQQASRIVVPMQANASGSGDIRSITIEKLEPSSKYLMRALAVNVIGQSKFNQPIEFSTDEEAPEASPANIKAQAINSTSILVSWDEVSRGKQAGRIHGYYVGYRLAPGTSRNNSLASSNNFVYKPYLLNTEHGNQAAARLEYTINDLRRDTVYEITVVAFNARGSGPSSEFVLAKTIEMEPPKPVKVQIRRESNDSIFIEWSRDPTDQNPVDDYVLYQEKDSAAQEWGQVRLPGNQTQYKAPGLKCGTRYQFYIVAHNKVGKSLHSEVVGASTSGSLPAIPSKMSLLKMVNSSCLLVNLNSFQDNGCRIRTFTVRYRVEKTSNPQSGQPHPLISAANGLAVQHQALTALAKTNAANASPSSQPVSASTSSALAGSQAPSDWISIRPKINQKHQNVLEEDRMEYICNLNPVGEYTLHVAAQNDVGRSEIEYTVLMSSDELRHSILREFGELLSNLPNVFVFLLAGLFVSLASLVLYSTVVKYYQKFLIIHNQIRASRRAKQDEKRRRKLMNSSKGSGKHNQRLDLWADEFDDDDQDEEGLEADGDDEACDEDENSSSSGSSGSGLNQPLHQRQLSSQQQRHSISAAHLQFVKQQQQQQQHHLHQQRQQRLGHYISNIANSAFDSSSMDSPCNNSLLGAGKQCYNNGSTCMSTASTDSIHGRFQCLNSRQYVKKNEYTMLPTISASLSPPRASDIYGTSSGARPSPQHQLPVLNSILPNPANGAQQQQQSGNNSIYYSTLRRSNMQTYLPQQRRSSAAAPAPNVVQANGPLAGNALNRQSQNIADIYGYYMAPAATAASQQQLANSPAKNSQQQQQPANHLRSGPIQNEEVANSIFVPPQQIIYSAPNIRHQPVFL